MISVTSLYPDLFEGREILHPTSEEMRDRVLAAAVDVDQISLAAQLAIGPEVEFVPVKRNWRKFWLETDKDGPGYSRSKVYGKVAIDSEEIACRSGNLRTRFLTLGREIGFHIAREIAARSWKASATVRTVGSGLVKSLGRGAEETPVVLQDGDYDSLVMLYAAYYVIAPVGEEWVPADG